MKKILILAVYIMATSLVGCGAEEEKVSNEKEEIVYDTLLKGNYFSQNDSSFIVLDVHNKEIGLAEENKIKAGEAGESFNYKIESNTIVASSDSSEQIVIDIIDNRTLKLEDELFVYKESTSDVGSIKPGIYYSETTSAYFWIDDFYTLRYVAEYVSGSVKYVYFVDGDKLVASSYLGTMTFEIINEDSLKLDEDVFCLDETQ